MTLRSVFTSALVFAVVAPAGNARAQTADDLFDVRTIQDIQIFMNSRDLQTLRSRVLEDTHYAADVQWRGIRIRNAAVRSRGGTSRSPTKPSLRIEFNRYNSRGELVGLAALTLDNSLQDPGFIRERIAMAFFARMGLQAPRESYCRLFINNLYQGVYTIAEGMDSRWTARSFSDPTGHLFQYRLGDPYFGQDLGDDLTPYTVRFERQTHELDSVAVLYTPIREMIRQLNGPDDAVFREMVEKYLDLSQFVTYVAIETFLSQEDGFLGIHGMNNFFLYRPGSGNQHRLVPWDQDKIFASVESGLFERADDNIWFRRAIAFPDLRALYLQVLEDCARSAVQDDWLLQQIEIGAAAVDAAVRADPFKTSTNDEFDAAIAFFRDFAQRRSPFVLAQVAIERARSGVRAGIR